MMRDAWLALLQRHCVTGKGNAWPSPSAAGRCCFPTSVPGDARLQHLMFETKKLGHHFIVLNVLLSSASYARHAMLGMFCWACFAGLATLGMLCWAQRLTQQCIFASITQNPVALLCNRHKNTQCSMWQQRWCSQENELMLKCER